MKKRTNTPPPSPEPLDDPGQKAMVEGVLDVALDQGRRDGTRLHALQRALSFVAVVGLVAVTARGSLEVASRAPFIAAALLAAAALFVATLVWSWQVGRRLERRLRDLQALETAREGLADGSPRVEVRPFEMPDGQEVPVVVVRVDSLERLLRIGEGSPDRHATWLARGGWSVAAACAIGALATLALPRVPAGNRWTFADPSDPAELGLRVIGERAGAWRIEEHATATGAHALASRPETPDAPAATLVARGFVAHDVRATTRCKVTSDSSSSSCGVAIRFRDAENHDVVRIDFASRRLVVASVVAGVERELAAVPARVDVGVWQELSVEVRGGAVRASCNHREEVVSRDAAPTAPGSVGLWAPGEAYFDDLAIEELPRNTGPAGALSLLRGDG